MHNTISYLHHYAISDYNKLKNFGGYNLINWLLRDALSNEFIFGSQLVALLKYFLYHLYAFIELASSTVVYYISNQPPCWLSITMPSL